MCKPIETGGGVVDRAVADDVGDVNVQVSETNADIATAKVVETMYLSQNALALGLVVGARQ